MLDCESLYNKKVWYQILMSCHPYLLMRCFHYPMMIYQWDPNLKVVKYMYYKLISCDEYMCWICLKTVYVKFLSLVVLSLFLKFYRHYGISSLGLCNSFIIFVSCYVPYFHISILPCVLSPCFVLEKPTSSLPNVWLFSLWNIFSLTKSFLKAPCF